MEYSTQNLKRNLFLIKKVNKDTPNYPKRAIKGRWTQEEHNAFIKACIKFGCNWKEVFYFKSDSCPEVHNQAL
jgi:hypothetical protein